MVLIGVSCERANIRHITDPIDNGCGYGDILAGQATEHDYRS